MKLARFELLSIERRLAEFDAELKRGSASIPLKLLWVSSECQWDWLIEMKKCQRRRKKLSRNFAGCPRVIHSTISISSVTWFRHEDTCCTATSFTVQLSYALPIVHTRCTWHRSVLFALLQFLKRHFRCLFLDDASQLRLLAVWEDQHRWRPFFDHTY